MVAGTDAAVAAAVFDQPPEYPGAAAPAFVPGQCGRLARWVVRLPNPVPSWYSARDREAKIV